VTGRVVEITGDTNALLRHGEQPVALRVALVAQGALFEVG